MSQLCVLFRENYVDCSSCRFWFTESFFLHVMMRMEFSNCHSMGYVVFGGGTAVYCDGYMMVFLVGSVGWRILK